MSLNRVMLTGNLTANAELRMTKSQTEVLTARIAVDEWSRNRETGEQTKRTSYFDLVAFGSRWNNVVPYLKKGVKVAIDGALRQMAWETEDGQRRSKVEIIVNRIDFMSTQNPPSGAERPVSKPLAGTSMEIDGQEVQPSVSIAGMPAMPDLYDEEVEF